MTLKIPEIWRQDQYYRAIAVVTSGAQAQTHLAELQHTDGTLWRAYVKHYDETVAPNALYNEYFGHIILSALNVPQPPAVIMPAPRFGTSVVAWAFCSLEPRPVFQGSAKQLYDYNDPIQLASLTKRLFDDCWHLLPTLVAADQLIMNGDRNIGNIVFTGKKSFVAIDSGDILGGIQFPRLELAKPQPWSRSVLIEGLVQLSSLKDDQRTTLLAAAQCVVEVFDAQQAALMQALNVKGHGQAAVCFDAVWWRTLVLEGLFRSKLGILT